MCCVICTCSMFDSLLRLSKSKRTCEWAQSTQDMLVFGCRYLVISAPCNIIVARLRWWLRFAPLARWSCRWKLQKNCSGNSCFDTKLAIWGEFGSIWTPIGPIRPLCCHSRLTQAPTITHRWFQGRNWPYEVMLTQFEHKLVHQAILVPFHAELHADLLRKQTKQVHMK
jgi:hypothetical protein